MTTPESQEAPSTPVGGASACSTCNEEPRIAGRSIGKACKAVEEKGRRERTRDLKAALPCSIVDCPAPRYVTPSQVSSYCKEHHVTVKREGRERRAPAVMTDERACQREACDETFTWSSVSPHQRFCSKKCRELGVDEERAEARRVQRMTVAGKTWCTGHREFVANESFTETELGKRSSKCRDCHRSDRERRGEVLDPDVRRERHRVYARTSRFKQYGITPEEFDALVLEQGGRCKICARERSLVPDHCHAGSGFRGAICGSCNTGLGSFGDDPVALRAAADYLEQLSRPDGPYRGFVGP